MKKPRFTLQGKLLVVILPIIVISNIIIGALAFNISSKSLNTSIHNQLAVISEIIDVIVLLIKGNALLDMVEKIDLGYGMHPGIINKKTGLTIANANENTGEAGKGFSVVADEIRKLSETSSEQSSTISGRVTDSIKQIGDEIGLFKV